MGSRKCFQAELRIAIEKREPRCCCKTMLAPDTSCRCYCYCRTMTAGTVVRRTGCCTMSPGYCNRQTVELDRTAREGMIELVDRIVVEDMPVRVVGMERVPNDAVVAVEQMVQPGMRFDRRSLVLLILSIRNLEHFVGCRNVVVAVDVDFVSSPLLIPALVDCMIEQVVEEEVEADIVAVAVVGCCSHLFWIRIQNPTLDSLKFLSLSLQFVLPSGKKVDQTLAEVCEEVQDQRNMRWTG